jgi:hypothetical protein
MVGGTYEPSVLAAFPVASMEQAIAFWETKKDDEYDPPVVEVWEADRFVGRIYDLKAGRVISPDGMSTTSLVTPNKRRSKRSSRRKR